MGAFLGSKSDFLVKRKVQNNVLHVKMLHYIGLISLVFALCGCVSLSDDKEWATGFHRGQIIQDLRPLKPSQSTDLREMAFTLPIIEVRDPTTFDWFYEMSEAAPTQETWDLPADGAQAPATLVRLPRHEDGSQQIELRLFPLPTGVPPKPVSHYSRLKRIDGGWLVLKAWKQ